MNTSTVPQSSAKADADRLLSEPELLRRLPVSRRSLRYWRAAGKLPHIRLGRRVLYHWPSLESALLRMQKGGAQ